MYEGGQPSYRVSGSLFLRVVLLVVALVNKIKWSFNVQILKSESSSIPLPVDDTSSPTTVYVNENVVESERTDETTGETSTVYRYDVRLYSRDEWEKLQMANRIIDLECALIDAESEI